jgi:hypothetical protein
MGKSVLFVVGLIVFLGVGFGAAVLTGAVGLPRSTQYFLDNPMKAGAMSIECATDGQQSWTMRMTCRNLETALERLAIE